MILRLSRSFVPIKRDVSSDVSLPSHRLMLRAGLIKQVVSGIYAWLPLGIRVLQKIENIIREELNEEGFQEILMPTIQPISLWEESGRGEYCGKETLKIKDRHGVGYIYGPTAEEVVTFLAKNEIKSYRDLPCTLYNIQWKFRDEVRPRFGVMRGREFLMLDSYSFDVSKEAAITNYNKHFDAFLRIFSRMGLSAIPIQADPGEIGGDLSHEFSILAENGESEIVYDPNLRLSSGATRHDFSKFYAADIEKHGSKPIDGLAKCRGIEVGHIFYFGTKYSESMKCYVQSENGSSFAPEMGSYGIGVSRLIAAFIEANHDENGIKWHKSISPFDLHLINLAPNDEECVQYTNELIDILKNQGARDILYDDTNDSPGEKFAKADLIGIPSRIVVSKKLVKDRKIELKNRCTGEVRIVDITSSSLYEF